MKKEFDSLLKAIKVYTDFYGYGLERTITSPNVGSSPYATKQRFGAFNGKLFIKVDHFDGKWVVKVYIEDREGKRQFEDEVESDQDFIKTAKKVQAMLSKLPRNEFHTPMQESFLRDFDRSTLYILEEEFTGIINECI